MTNKENLASTGISGLDAVLLRNRLYLVDGNPGGR